MQVFKELTQPERDILKEKHKHHQLFVSHIEAVLNKIHCYEVNIYARDYEKILIHSCLSDTTDRYPYQYLSEAVAYLQAHQDFLNTSAQGCLNGTQVQHYMVELSKCPSKPKDCFVMMGDCFMLDKSDASASMRIEITDGMHRLVAYGLTTNMNEQHFPIPIYFGTDKTLDYHWR